MAKPKRVPPRVTLPRPQDKTVISSDFIEEVGTLRFSFAEIDEGGKWPAHKIRGNHIERLMKRLKSLECQTPSQLMANHTLSALDMSKCTNKPAKQRLATQYEGLDVLHELRIAPGEDQRLHGRLVGRFFNVIWWDPNHEVWADGNRNRR